MKNTEKSIVDATATNERAGNDREQESLASILILLYLTALKDGEIKL